SRTALSLAMSAGCSGRSAFFTCALNAGGSDPRMVTGSFGIGLDAQICRYFDASNWPACVAVACSWVFTSAASILPFVRARSDCGWPPAYLTLTSLGERPAFFIAKRGRASPEVEPGSDSASVWPLRSAMLWIGESFGTQVPAL